MKTNDINIVILGSTGTIGVNSLEVIQHSKTHKVLALSAGRNINLLKKQIQTFSPRYVCVLESKERESLEKEFPNIQFFDSEEGLKKLVTLNACDLVISAIVGFAGFIPTYYAIKAGKRVALANKESLVAGGFLFTQDEIKQMIPIDSEHSAIHQILHQRPKASIKRLLITASGGPFLHYTKEDMQHITKQEALCHPNWSMGNKITIDSSTMVNKTLEIIEAHYLFGLQYDAISVVVHPQSIVHSMVEFKDGSILAQLANPDMKIPISQAIHYPKIESYAYQGLDFTQLLQFSFLPPDTEKFPSLKLAQQVIENPQLGVVLNRANEVAVDAFLNDRIHWCDIYKIIKKVMQTYPLQTIHSIHDLQKTDQDVKAFTEALIPS